MPPAFSFRRVTLGRPLTIAVLTAGVCEFVGGAYFGFGTLSAHLEWWVLSLLLGFAAFVIADRLFPAPERAEVWIRTGVLSFALVVLCGLTLGATHLLAPAPYVITESLLVVCAISALPRGVQPRGDPPTSLPVAVLGLWIAIVAFVVGMGMSHSPFIAYDSLSYHLFFPARWFQAHRLSIIPTPFSDEAQAYQPANGELWLLWLMLPFHGDLLARIGQLPFYLMAATTVYRLARRLGAKPVHAMYAPTFFLITPTVVDQAVGANVDLIAATMFVTSLYVGIVAVDSNERRDWAMWGISVGLFLGTKYLALVYLPILLVVPVIRGLRVRALWALPGIAAFGLPWYVRNWVVTGSPIYPATLTMAGVTIGQGAYTRQAMLQSYAHTTDLRLLAVALIHAFGTAFFLFALPAAALALVALVRRRTWWPAGFVMLASVAGVLLCWLGVGDNVDSRFLLPAVVTLVTMLPLSFGHSRRLNAGVHIFYALGIVWVLVGAQTQLHASLPWYMADWLTLHGIIDKTFLVHFALLASAAALSVRIAPGRQSIAAVVVGLVSAASVTLAIGAETWCVPSRCDFLQVASPHLRLDFVYGSRWLNAHVSAATIAYTGINLPYPLSGSHLSNVVYYVNIDGHTDWRFDDYARAFRRASARRPDGAALATGSGLLRPMAQREGLFDALRPRFERMSGDQDAWKTNLKIRGVGWVFISTLDPYEIDYVWHNARGFPIEDEWAKADPSVFRLVYENPNVRIYAVTSP